MGENTREDLIVNAVTSDESVVLTLQGYHVMLFWSGAKFSRDPRLKSQPCTCLQQTNRFIFPNSVHFQISIQSNHELVQLLPSGG